MVDNPVSMEIYEKSCDIEFGLDFNEEPILTASNGVSQKKNQISALLVTIDDVIGISDNCLSNRRKVTEAVREKLKLDGIEVVAISRDSFSQLYKELTSLENHTPDSSSKVDGFSSKRSRDDADEYGFEKLNSSFKNILGNGSLKNMRRSKNDLPIVNSCDKFLHQSDRNRVNGDNPKPCGDESTSPGDSDSESENGFGCLEKQAKMDESENSSICSMRSLRIDESDGPHGQSDGENSISSVNNCQQRKKTTARKSTGGISLKITAHLLEDDCVKEQLAEAEDLVVSTENGENNLKTNSDDAHEGLKSPTDDRHQTSVDESRLPPVAKKYSSPADKGRLSTVLRACQSPLDEKYPIKLTKESWSDENLKNIFTERRKQFGVRQMEEVVVQKCCEVIAESSHIGEIKKQFAELEESNGFKKKQIDNLQKQLFQLKSIADIFRKKAQKLKENGQVPLPKVIVRNVGLQVDPLTSFAPASIVTRSNSVDEGDRTSPCAVTNSQTSSTDTCLSSSCSSPPKSSTESFSEIVDTSKSQKPSLPTDNSPVVAGETNAILPVEKNLPSKSALIPPAPSVDDIVDLTDVDDNVDVPPRPSIAPRNGSAMCRRRPSSSWLPISPRHPAPLPQTPYSRHIPGAKLPPPKPNLSVQKTNSGVRMTWDLRLDAHYESIISYEIYAYQETVDTPASVSLWKSVGDAESLDLPMTCTLTQFVDNHTYHLAVRAVDKYGRQGPFSCAKSVAL